MLVVLAGDAANCLDTVFDTYAASVPPASDNAVQPGGQSVSSFTETIMHVPDRHSNSDISDQISSLLGSEHACVVFDANGGFDVRLMAASTGTVIGGGLIVLLTPPLQEWAAQQAESAGKHSSFVERLVSRLLKHQTQIIPTEPSVANERAEADAIVTSNHVALIIGPPNTGDHKTDQAKAVFHPSTAAPTNNDAFRDWQVEQDALLAQLLKRLSADLPPRPPAISLTRSDTIPSPEKHAVSKYQHVIVVQGDRGRGKSALIGRAIKQFSTLSISAHRSISLCSTRRSATDILLKHAAQEIPFFTIEQALSHKHDVLVVEEAGSIPLSILEKLLARSKLIVFATTIQGYEGAGRGFAIRFAQQLDAIAPDWLKLEPKHPIRWSQGDPVEAFVNDAFLSANTFTPLLATQRLILENTEVVQIDKRELLNNDALLCEIYALLVQAHYQTTPADLRNMMDKESLLIFVQRVRNTQPNLSGSENDSSATNERESQQASMHNHAKHCSSVMTGAALLALEGRIETELHKPILEKQRRLKDQIIPQLLAQSAGIGHGLGLRYARVVRIAIRPEIQQQGFGTHLFEQLTDLLAPGIDYVGASFGADERTLSFWLKLGLKPIHYGYKANPRSGLRSVCMVKSCNDSPASLIDRASQILHTNVTALNHNAAAPNRVMETLIDATLDGKNLLPSDVVRQLLNAYADSKRSFIDSVGLMFVHTPLAQEHELLSRVRQTLKHYATLPPTDRRREEEHIKMALKASIGE